MRRPKVCCTVLLWAGVSLAGTCVASDLREAAAVGAEEWLQSSSDPTGSQRHFREAAKHRFEFDNDVLFGTDNQFSNGWSFQVHSQVADSWQNLPGPAPWLRDIGDWLPTLTNA